MDVTLVVLMQNLFPKNMRTFRSTPTASSSSCNPRDQSQFRRLAAQASPAIPTGAQGAALRPADSLPPSDPGL